MFDLIGRKVTNDAGGTLIECGKNLGCTRIQSLATMPVFYKFATMLTKIENMNPQTSILAAITLASFLVACNSNNGQKQQEDSTKTNPVTSATVEKPAPSGKLVGKWVQPIPGQESDKQGIQLNPDGTASSVNMHTLVYEKWELKGDTLILWNHTTGVKAAAPGIDTTIIKQVTDSTLILIRNSGMELSYTREK